jgi:hypothetical protein
MTPSLALKVRVSTEKSRSDWAKETKTQQKQSRVLMKNFIEVHNG